MNFATQTSEGLQTVSTAYLRFATGNSSKTVKEPYILIWFGDLVLDVNGLTQSADPYLRKYANR